METRKKGTPAPGDYLEQHPHLTLVVLRRRDGYFVAAFSLSGVEREVIEEVAWLDSQGEPSIAESQLSELQNMWILLQEAGVQARGLAYHRRARLKTVIGQALDELERQIEELRERRYVTGLRSDTLLSSAPLRKGLGI